MHSCDHDGRTASLLGLAKALNSMQVDIEGTIVFLHHHTEELPPGGANAMIEDGCLEGVDVIFGTHLQAQMPLGEIGYRSGPLLIASTSKSWGRADTPHAHMIQKTAL